MPKVEPAATGTSELHSSGSKFQTCRVQAWMKALN